MSIVLTTLKTEVGSHVSPRVQSGTTKGKLHFRESKEVRRGSKKGPLKTFKSINNNFFLKYVIGDFSYVSWSPRPE